MRKEGIRAIFITVLSVGLVLLGPAAVVAQEDIPEYLMDLDCLDLRIQGLSQVADYFYADETDRALSIIMFIEGECGSREPLRRVKLLGAIWDGSFVEEMYGDEIINDLAKRGGEQFPDPSFAHFDSFTTNLADQLLPHLERESVEEFFCLFHSGRTAEAYALLQGEALGDSDLAYYYAGELRRMDESKLCATYGVFGSYWHPSGNMKKFGNHAMVGASVGGVFGEYYTRFNIAFRLARSAEPYFVDFNGQSAWSDRSVGAKMTIDLGQYTHKGDHHELGFFVGGGMEYLQPFHDLDDFSFKGFLGLLGVEYKLWLGESQLWNISIDLKREWYGFWDGTGTDLSGTAWDLRLGCGIALGDSRFNKRRASLGR